MNNDQAKFILKSYRAGSEDAADPAFREAIEQARRDPALGHWLAGEQAQDRAVRAGLESVPAPATLRDDILAARAFEARRRRRGGRYRALALAAVLLAISGLAVFYLRPQPPLTYAAYPQMAARLLSRPFALALETKDIGEVRAWLGTAGASPETHLPARLAATAPSGLGCRAFAWRGQPVLLVCFALESGKPTHLFVMNEDALEGAAPGEPRCAQQGKWATATWTRDGRAYLLAAEGRLADMEGFLRDAAAG